MKSFEIYLSDEKDTQELGNALAKYASMQDVFALKGNLGSGKTVLARSFIQEYCADENTTVSSPTYNIVQVYDDCPSGIAIWHFDLYRLENLEDIWETGIEEAFGDGISIIEWSEKAANILPKEKTIIISIRADDSQNDCKRIVQIIPPSEKWANNLELIMQELG
jgi:tRNA threonylcarbamoyladenosine biosynthesis protein TsaE